MKDGNVFGKKGQASRKKLIVRGFSLLMRQGVENTSLEEILQFCGVKKGSFYYYFSSKEEFVQVCLEECYIQPQREVMAELQRTDCPDFSEITDLFVHVTERMQEKLDDILGEYTLALYSFYAELIHLSSVSSEMVGAYYANNNKWLNWIASGLRRMQEQGEIASDVDCWEAAKLMYYYREGILTVWAHDGKIDIEENIVGAMAYFKRMLGAKK